MHVVLKAGVAFVLAALITGQITPSPRWRDVAADLHQAQPQAKVKAQIAALLHNKD